MSRKLKTIKPSTNKSPNACGQASDYVCDFKRLEHIIETKANDAVKDVDKRLRYIGASVAAISLLGFWPLFSWYHDYVLQTVTARFVEAKLAAKIDSVVPDMIDKRYSVFDTNVSSIARRLTDDMSNMVSQAEESFSTQSQMLKRELFEANDQLNFIADIMSAHAGDRQAYDRLGKIETLTNEQGRMAYDARKAIKEKYLARKLSLENGLYYGGLTPCELRDYSKEYYWTTMAYADRDFNCEGAIIELMRTNDKHNVATLIHVVEKSKRLNSVYTAICGVERLTGEKFDALGVDQILAWWKQNCSRDDFHNGFEKYFDYFENGVGTIQPGESSDHYGWRKVLALDKIIKDKPELYHAATTLIPIACYIKVPEHDELRKEILNRAISIVETKKDLCEDWDVYNLKSVFL